MSGARVEAVGHGPIAIGFEVNFLGARSFIRGCTQLYEPALLVSKDELPEAHCSFGSSASRSQSPVRLNPRTVTAMAPPEIKASLGARSKYAVP